MSNVNDSSNRRQSRPSVAVGRRGRVIAVQCFLRGLKWSGWFVFLICSHGVGVANEATGRIEGVVQTEGGMPLADVNISVEEPALGVVSSATGRFSLIGVPGGERTVAAGLLGYRSTRLQVAVAANAVTRVRIVLSPETTALPAIVVTGTRSAQSIEDTPIQTQVITRREIDATGVVNLGSLLAEQTGLAVISDHGTGVQVQGFDPDYTLILVDGEPVIGRTAGTLDLDRYLVSNLEQVEIVKGSTSSLYGSEALAGVINLITRLPEKPFSASIRPRYGSFGTLNFTGELESRQRKVGVSLFVDGSHSNGYDHTPETVSPTAPEYVTYTASPKVFYEPGDRVTVSLSARAFQEHQNSPEEIRSRSETVLIDRNARQTDWNINPRFVFQWTPGLRISGKLYTANYHTRSERTRADNGESYDVATFDQNYHKAELQAHSLIGRTSIMTLGAGAVWESVEADRITGGRQSSRSVFAYLQEEWLPAPWLDVVVSARIDAHSDYASRASPKAALLIKPLPWLHLRGSAGSGFKAPTFQQLYLDFTNPSVGYSVLGSTYVREGMALMRDEGQIAAVLQDAETLEQIRAESAVSFNTGVEITPNGRVSAKINFFHNNVQDLIEASPIARKKSGQSVYTYFNLNHVFTRGMESEIKIRVSEAAGLSAGYQYLKTGDRDVLDRLDDGQIVTVDSETNKLRRVEIPEYGGLFNRSTHTATLRFFYRNEKTGFGGSLRGVYRGRYGFQDRNLTNILDAPEEYAPGYRLWHMSLSQRIKDFAATIRLGVRNIFDEKRLDYIPSLPGRMLFADLTRDF